MDRQAVIEVEVVYALPEEQVVLRVILPLGATVEQAIRNSGLITRYPDIAGTIQRPGNVGIFGKAVTLEMPLRAFDRVEIYRGLTVDPKEARRRRALLRAIRAQPATR